MAFFIGIACPWLVLAVLDMMGSSRRDQELVTLGILPGSPSPISQSSYLCSVPA